MSPVNSRRRPLPDGEAAASVRPPVWVVYLLRCADGTLYAGATNDLERRLRAHAAGQVKYTRGRLPVEPVWVETVGERGAALRREAAIKRLRRAAKEALLLLHRRPARL